MAADAQYDEAHALTRLAKGTPYACHGRTKMADGYWAPNGVKVHILYDEVGHPHPVRSVVKLERWIPHVMSTECRVVNTDKDVRCAGCCNVGKGDVYAAMVEGSAK